MDQSEGPRPQKAKRRTMTREERDRERTDGPRKAGRNREDNTNARRDDRRASSAMTPGEELARTTPDVSDEAPGEGEERVYQGFKDESDRRDQ